MRFVLATILLVATIAAAEPPSPAQLDELVRQLGDKRFTVREQATKKLWQLGPGVETALKAAAKDADVEVAMRAKSLLDKFTWGIFFDTPQAVVTEIEHFRDGDSDARRRAAIALAELGPPGVQALGRLRAKIDTDEQRAALNEALALAAIRAVPPLLKERKFDELQALLESCLDRKADEAAANYAALLLLRGKLPEQLARWQADYAAVPSPRIAEILVALHRASGDLAAARKLAAVRADLLDGILWEQGDWAELARRPIDRDAEAADRRQPAVERATRARYFRLAGDTAGADAQIDKLREIADPAEEWTVTKGLLLNERVAESLERLTKSDHWREAAFDLLVAQMRYREAFALAEKIGVDGDSERSARFAIKRARALYLIGERDQASQTFTAARAKLQAGGETEVTAEMVQTQMRLGLRDAARESAALFLAVAGRQSPDSPQESMRRVLEAAFPKKGVEASIWWAHLRQRFANEDEPATMRRLISLIEPGDAKAADPGDLVKSLLAGVNADDAYAAVAARLAAATAYETAGQWNRAVEHLTEAAKRASEAKVHALHPAIRLGDLHAGRQNFREAADAYRQAAVREPNEPLPLYLCGWALGRAGQAAESAAVLDDARLLSLGDVRKRAVVAEELAKRDLTDLARRERELVVLLGWRRAWASGSLLSFQARDAGARKDFARAADGYERLIASLLASDFSFVENSAYLTVPATAHAYRARAALAAGKFDAVRAEADACLNLTPGNLDLAILLIPELTRNGRSADADALYARAAGPYAELCKDHPTSAFAHNSAAWLAAVCRRDLDAALDHARKATTLAPAHAGYRDTLAEVHFQRGDRAKAIELIRECQKLEPKNNYFGKQLRRFESGDPGAPPPPETDDE